MSRSLSFEIAAQVGSRIICSLMGLVLITQLSRYLSIDDFGIYTLAFSVLAFFSPVVEIGMNTIAIREIARNPEQSEAILSSVISVKLVMAMIAWVVASFFAIWLGTDTHQQIVIVLTSLGLFNLALNSFDIWLVIHHRMIIWGAAQVLAGLLGLVLTLLLIWAGWSLYTIVLVQVGAVGLVYGWVWLRVRGEFQFQWPKFQMVRVIVRESLPQGIASLITAYYFNIDMIMLAKMINTEGVAFYGAAYRLLGLMVFVPHAIMMSFMPLMTRALKAGEKPFEQLFRYAFQLMMYLSIPIAMWSSWFAEDIIGWIYTDAYAPAAPVLILLVWAGVGVFASHLSGYALVILNRQELGMFISAASLGLNVMLNLWMIRIWGIRGAAVATLVTETLVVIAGYLLCFYYARILPFSSLLFRSVVLATVVALILNAGRENVVFSTFLVFGSVGFSFFYFLRSKDSVLLNEFLETK